MAPPEALAMAPPECIQEGWPHGKKGGSKGGAKGKEGGSKGKKCGSKGKKGGSKGWSKGKYGVQAAVAGLRHLQAEANAGNSGARGSGDSSGPDLAQQAMLNHPLIAPGEVASRAASSNGAASKEGFTSATGVDPPGFKAFKNAKDGHFASKQK